MDMLARWVGKDLAGVEDAVYIEHILDALHGVEVVRAVDPGHEGTLLEADPVLAGQCASELHYGAQHFLAGALDLVHHLAVAQVEQDARAHAAVASVTHIADPQLLL